jgi:RNA recognition motif-containing protein
MNILISNLGDSITNNSLEAVLATYGEVSSAKIFAKQIAGRMESVALIEMPNENEAFLAIAKLNGRILDGHAIKVTRHSDQENVALRT